MKDILGTALLDYHRGNYSEDIITETNISEADSLPIPYFFRSYPEMPAVEQKALDLCKGNVLDVGCGAGSHGLYLQNKGLKVSCIDISEGAVIVSGLRGIKDVRQENILDITNEKFDTVLLLMNGTGIFQKLASISTYLQHLKNILSPKGQVLIDSSDLQYMYDQGEDGGIWIPSEKYYGELAFTMTYKKEKSESFDWLYLDKGIFESAAHSNGFNFEVLLDGENFDYLAKLTVADDSL